MKPNPRLLAEQYRQALLENVIPFWEANSPDWEAGGYFTCLDKRGQVYDTDKFVWLQARQVWTFSMLYNRVEARQPWLDMAQLGFTFLRDKARDSEGKVFFSLDRWGKPLIHPYNIFSDCFAAMAFSQYAQAAESEESQALAQATFRNILQRQGNPKGMWEKRTGNRPLKGFSLPMILSNLALEMEQSLTPAEVEQTLDTSIQEVLEVFYDPDFQLVFEYVSPDGSHPNCFEGRLINPGHGLEAMWFLMDIGQRRNDKKLIDQAVNITLQLLDFGWDSEHGGIFYFLDAQDAPPLQLEWDQKLWWVHLEALVALAKAYALTQKESVWKWYERVHTYTWSHFPDPENGEWFGYLNRQGTPFIPLKGGKWKGCFHVPRAMYQCWKVFGTLDSQQLTQ